VKANRRSRWPSSGEADEQRRHSDSAREWRKPQENRLSSASPSSEGLSCRAPIEHIRRNSRDPLDGLQDPIQSRLQGKPTRSSARCRPDQSSDSPKPVEAACPRNGLTCNLTGKAATLLTSGSSVVTACMDCSCCALLCSAWECSYCAEAARSPACESCSCDVACLRVMGFRRLRRSKDTVLPPTTRRCDRSDKRQGLYVFYGVEMFRRLNP